MGFLDNLPGVGSVLSGVGGIASVFSQASANKANIRMNRENNEFQAQQAEINRNWQANMQRENNEFNRQQAIDMFKMQSDYDSPVEQVKRLQAAGFNPYLAYQGAGGDTGSVTASTPQSTTAGVQAVQPGTQPGHVQPIDFSQGFNAFSQLAQGVSALATAKQTGINTEWLEQTFRSRVNEQAANEKLARANSRAQQTLSRIIQNNEMHLNKKVKAELDMIIEQVNNVAADTDLKIQQKEVAKAEESLKRFQRQLTQYQSAQFQPFHDAYTTYLAEIKKQWKNQNLVSESQVNANNASAENARASAQKALSDAKRTMALLPLEKRSLALKNVFDKIQGKLSSKETAARIANLWKDFDLGKGDGIFALISSVNSVLSSLDDRNAFVDVLNDELDNQLDDILSNEEK